MTSCALTSSNTLGPIVGIATCGSTTRTGTHTCVRVVLTATVRLSPLKNDSWTDGKTKAPPMLAGTSAMTPRRVTVHTSGELLSLSLLRTSPTCKARLLPSAATSSEPMRSCSVAGFPFRHSTTLLFPVELVSYTSVNTKMPAWLN